jgi:hypothetical protein
MTGINPEGKNPVQENYEHAITSPIDVKPQECTQHSHTYPHKLPHI